MTGTDYKLTANVVAHFEGFSRAAYYDVNAWRIGFGSDTRWTGSESVAVQGGDLTTRDFALVELQSRIEQFEQTIIEQVGIAWGSLGPNTRAALIDFAYNYGRLTPTLATLVKESQSSINSGISAISREVSARAEDNAYANSTRRKCEACLIASEG